MAEEDQNADLDFLSTSRILNLPDPNSAQQAATKAYVDGVAGVAGLHWSDLPSLVGTDVASGDKFLVGDISNATLDPDGSLSIMSPAELLTYLRRNGMPDAKNGGASATTNSSSTVPTDITNLIWNVVNGRSYHINFKATFQSAATTTGIGILLAATTTTLAGNARAHIKVRQAAAGTDSYFEDMGPPGTILVNASVVAANTDYDLEYEAWFTAATADGTVKLQVRSEINASQVTIQAHSVAWMIDCTG